MRVTRKQTWNRRMWGRSRTPRTANTGTQCPCWSCLCPHGRTACRCGCRRTRLSAGSSSCLGRSHALESPSLCRVLSRITLWGDSLFCSRAILPSFLSLSASIFADCTQIRCCSSSLLLHPSRNSIRSAVLTHLPEEDMILFSWSWSNRGVRGCRLWFQTTVSETHLSFWNLRRCFHGQRDKTHCCYYLLSTDPNSCYLVSFDIFHRYSQFQFCSELFCFWFCELGAFLENHFQAWEYT